MSSIASTVTTSNIIQTASGTINRAVAGVSRDAAVVASPAALDTPQEIAALIDSRQQLLYAQAGAKMVTAADQMMGSLLDIFV